MHQRDRGEPMRCPNCGTRLVEVERSELLIDACPECRGVWLDRGELDRLLERERRAMMPSHADPDDDFFAEVEGRRARTKTPPPPAARDDRPRPPRYDDDYEDEKRRKKRKRKGMLEDLFDF